MDVVDYVNWGYIGCKSSENCSGISADNVNYDDARVTSLATAAALQRVVLEFFLGTLAMYKYIYDDGSGEKSYYAGISEENYNACLDFFVELHDLYNQSEITRMLFWNSLQSVELKQTENIELTFKKVILVIPEGENVKYIDFEDINLPVNYSLYQNLTKELYDDYMNITAEYMYRIKFAIKVLTNSDFEEIIL